jgi:hypothetical protein
MAKYGQPLSVQANPLRAASPIPAPIHAVGAPPERYADRVTAEMLRYLAAQSAHIRATVREIVEATADDGGPRGQERLRKRIIAAGTTLGRVNVTANLVPGKRGKYEIFFMFWAGWDSEREEEITLADPIPERPQIIHWVARLESLGRYRRTLDYAPVLIISHHVLSRTAQRHGLRTLDDMLDAIEALNHRIARFSLEMSRKASDGMNWILQTPPEGWRVPINRQQDQPWKTSYRCWCCASTLQGHCRAMHVLSVSRTLPDENCCAAMRVRSRSEDRNRSQARRGTCGKYHKPPRRCFRRVRLLVLTPTRICLPQHCLDMSA